MSHTIMKHVINFIMLFFAVASGFLGAILFKSLYRDFSLIDFSFMTLLTSLLYSVLFITLGLYFGFYAFKRMRSS